MALTLPNDTLDVPWVEPKLMPVRVTLEPTVAESGEIVDMPGLLFGVVTFPVPADHTPMVPEVLEVSVL